MPTKNNHFVSKYLTRPWEWKKGKFRIFYHDTQTYGDVDSDDLFARDLIFSQAQEEFFNRYVEAYARPAFESIAKGVLAFKKWKVYRALVLLLWDSMGRHMAAVKGDFTAVNFLTSRTEKELDTYVNEIMKRFDLKIFTVGGGYRLFFPSTVVLYYIDETVQSCNFGIPIDGNKALFTYLKGSDDKLAEDISKSEYLCNISVGNSNTKFCILHPDHIPMEKILAEKLPLVRKDNDDFCRLLMNQLNQLGTATGSTIVRTPFSTN